VAELALPIKSWTDAKGETELRERERERELRKVSTKKGGKRERNRRNGKPGL